MENKDFALRLSRLREKHGTSARDMSLSIGQNPGYINNIETGKAKPSMDAFFYICEYLGITPKDFFDTDSTEPARICAIIEDMKKLREDQLRIVEALIKDMLRK